MRTGPRAIHARADDTIRRRMHCHRATDDVCAHAAPKWLACCASALVALVACMSVGAQAQASTKSATVRGEGYAGRAEVQAFIAGLVRDDGFDAMTLIRVFAQARPQPKVVAAMSRPIAAPPKWFEYAPQFLNAATNRRGSRLLACQRRGARARAETRSACPPK